MTVEEVKEIIQKVKKEDGLSDEQVVAVFYKMFQDDQITVEQLTDLVQLVGYKVTDEFLNMSPEDQKVKGFADEEPEEGKDEGSKKDPDDKNDNGVSDNDEEKARKLFGLDEK
jgi:hypothetical protein